MGRLEVDLLGTPRIRHDGVALSFPTRKALALLAYLVVEGGLHSREKLAALLWPDSDAQHGRGMLRYTLAHVRQATAHMAGAPHLAVERDGLGFDAASDAQVDLHRIAAARALLDGGVTDAAHVATGAAALDALRNAVGWCRGELLEGFSLPDTPAFDEWATLQRESWRQKVRPLFDRLSQLEADAGERGAAFETLMRWIAADPLNEDAHRRLMLHHLADRDRAAALRAYEVCRAILEKSLDVAPSPETEALAAQVRTGGGSWREPAPSPGQSAPVALGPPRSGPSPSGLVEGPLVGRAVEFRRFVERYQAARTGAAQIVTLEGEPGIGKTRLAGELLGWAGVQGADVLSGRAFEMGGRLPYQPLVDALRPRLERVNAPEDILGDVWLAELGRLLPELRDRYPDLETPAGDEAAARTRLFEAIVRFVQALARRAPVVLFVDDIQWADAGSLDVLRYATRRWAEARTPLLLVLGVRSEALAGTSGLDAWLVGLRRDLAVTRIELGPLAFEDTLRFVQELGSSGQRPAPLMTPAPAIEELARWLFAETGGQPLFLIETIRALLGRGTLLPSSRDGGGWRIDPGAGSVNMAPRGGPLPPGIIDVIHARLAHLGRHARDLLVAGAVLGQGFTFEQMCRVTGLSEDDALPATDEVLRADLLHERERDGLRASAGAYQFAHDKIREVVYAEAGDARRRIFHRRALEALNASAPAAQLARHALAAGLEDSAIRFSLAAGDAAMRLLAGRDALAHYARAVEIAERLDEPDILPDLHARRGKAFASVADWAEARRELEQALDGLAEDRRERRLEILTDMLEPCWWLLDMPGLRHAAHDVLASANELGRGDLETAAIGWLAGAVGADGDVAGCVAQCQRALARGHEIGIRTPPQVHTYISLSLYWLGDLDAAIERSREGVEAARSDNHTSAMMWCLPHLGISLAARGRYDEALQAFAEARRFGREYGVTTLLARAIAMSAGFHLDLDDFVGHEALALEARDLAGSLGFLPPAVSAGIDLLLNYARRQEVGKAEALVEGVAETVASTSGFHGWLWSLRLAEARAELALAVGDLEMALIWAGQAIDQSRARRRVKYHAIGLGTRAQALTGLGRTKEAAADLRNAVALARPLGDPSLFLRAAGGLLRLDGSDALAAEAATASSLIAARLSDPTQRSQFLASDLAGTARRQT